MRSVERPNAEPQRRVVVLGASNVTRGLRTFCQTAAKSWGSPLDVMAAIGHGRSYGLTTNVFGRTLPSISSCELWNEWQNRPQVPTAGLITDVGNDLLYGVEPRLIAHWVRKCCERLAERCDRVVVTGLPIETVSKLAPGRFKILRTILFPNSKLSWRQAIDNALELDERLAELAKSMNFGRTQPSSSWYGFDPIHIRRRYWPQAWQDLVRPWVDVPRDGSSANPMDVQWHALRLRPKHRLLFGREQHQTQPVWFGSDGSTLSLY